MKKYYTYLRTETPEMAAKCGYPDENWELYTVGETDKHEETFEPLSDHSTAEEAKAEVARLEAQQEAKEEDGIDGFAEVMGLKDNFKLARYLYQLNPGKARALLG